MASQSASQLGNRLFSQLVSKSASLSQSVSQLGNRLFSQSVSKSASQSVSQTISPSIKSVCRFIS